MTRQKQNYLIQGALFFLLISLVLVGSVWADSQIKVVGKGLDWPGFTRVDLEKMIPLAESFQTTDLNFKDDGLTLFTGIRISKLLEIANTDVRNGITVIGFDQYVGYLSKDQLANGFLTWEMNSKPIPGVKGGPMKIIFPSDAGVHSSCYTWYVETMVADIADQARLSVVKGEDILHYQRSDLAGRSILLARSMFSIAQGCRNAFTELSSVKTVQAVPLSSLLSVDGKIDHVQLVPFSGPVVTLEPEILDYSVYVIVGCDNRPLHPALGGPFSVVFPLEEHPELSGRVPESGALFFLEKIVVK